ncbi:MAG: hypothetical protein AAF197_06030, partial [Pseudomonadota bacterium]
PNIFSAAELDEILEVIAVNFHLDLPSRLQIAIETDPRFVSSQGIQELVNAGFNRFSIGIHEFPGWSETTSQQGSSLESTLSIIETACNATNLVSVDIYTELPSLNFSSIRGSMRQIAQSGVPRIAAPGFAYFANECDSQNKIKASEVASPNLRMSLRELTNEILCEEGFEHIGMDQYTLPHDPLLRALKNKSLQRDCMGYTTRVETDQVGIGMSAISTFSKAYAQNHTGLSEYRSAVQDRSLPIAKGVALTADDQIRRQVIQSIFCSGVVNFQAIYETLFEQAIPSAQIRSTLQIPSGAMRLANDNLIKMTNTGFTVTKLGRHFMPKIASLFDNYQSKNIDQANVRQFSKVL